MVCAGFAGEAHAGRIKEKDIRAHIAVLASDEFEGRGPGTAGEEKTVNYIREQWAKAGLVPAAQPQGSDEQSWFQNVPLTVYAPLRQEADFIKGRRRLRFSNKDILLVGSDPLYEKTGLPMLFVGTGLTSDGKAVADVAGKAVLLLEEAATDAPDDLKPLRRRVQLMADAGADAVISVLSDQTWKGAQRRFSRPVTRLANRDNRAPLQGVVSTEFAVGLVSASGGDWDKLSSSAYDPDFKAKAIGVRANFQVESRVDDFTSRNVIGKIAGQRPGSGAVLFMGHWDHFGLCGNEEDEDKICNGAVDNASGIAVLMAVAEKLARKKHDRDIYFMATTAEESGLLGAYHFASNPSFPLDKMAIALNLDTAAVAPKGSDVAIIGEGQGRMKPVLRKMLKKQRRKLDASGEADVFIRRQDGWTLTQDGYPAYIISSAFGDMELLNSFLAGNYHGPDDELTKATELGGATQDANLHVRMGRYFASIKKYSLPPSPVEIKKRAEASGGK